MDHPILKVELKCASMESGERFVITTGMLEMPGSFVDCWDTSQTLPLLSLFTAVEKVLSNLIMSVVLEVRLISLSVLHAPSVQLPCLLIVIISGMQESSAFQMVKLNAVTLLKPMMFNVIHPLICEMIIVYYIMR